MGQLIYIYLVKTRRFNIKNMTTKQKIFIAVSTVAVIGIVVMIVKSSKGTGNNNVKLDSGGINYDRAGTCKYMGKWVRDSSNSLCIG